MEDDIRWTQRFDNYRKALAKLQDAVDLVGNHLFADDARLMEIAREGLVQRFEYTHELAWNVMKDYAAYQGNNAVGGSRDATREALALKLIDDGEVWMAMIRSRNETSHTYNNAVAEAVGQKIITQYAPLLAKFQKTMERKCATV
ncbi:nucleotidyltransferase [Planctomycetales bacterium]|nr:nucleotidyltransferase [Planctomycetales bacterium]GHT00785.1 nucleotidyltransferase [Planctomycetales bacterium]